MNIDKQIIIIIGLPGSGKTTFSKQFKDHIIFDDFISKFYDGKVMETIKMNNKICLIDPRLCMYNIFQRIIDKILKITDKQNIHLILFKNDINKCIHNIKKRQIEHDNNENNDKINIHIVNEKTLYSYAKEYDLKNYNDFESTIIDVYSVIYE